ncbi:MAG: hypothetical protein C7B47_17565 [Sulfobacillus thermosulfidooxidans]|uniref:DUF3850 domain-containing protein n=1 Tax=Sulfobacillus thermosulfidooxidans TaxID=28034 RepID=A0A2T2WFI8_SULTH|nr:MAG: hypothetical protein C7B47_17565 [Sulfobacillus thermosulfidooxidans]
MTIHCLKIWPAYFRAIDTGAKTVELRAETDRTFAVGDILWLQEYVPSPSPHYTGRRLAVQVTHILRDPQGQWLAPHIAALSIRPIFPSYASS